jgi:hypothetical protein
MQILPMGETIHFAYKLTFKLFKSLFLLLFLRYSGQKNNFKYYVEFFVLSAFLYLSNSPPPKLRGGGGKDMCLASPFTASTQAQTKKCTLYNLQSQRQPNG